MVDRIRELCKGRKLSIHSLEEKIGFPNNTIAKWDVNRPSVDRVMAVADYFGVSAEYLVKGVKEV